MLANNFFFADPQSTDSFDARDSSNPFHPSSSTTPDLLINSLELKRTLRKWSRDKEKVSFRQLLFLGNGFLMANSCYYSYQRS